MHILTVLLMGVKCVPEMMLQLGSTEIICEGDLQFSFSSCWGPFFALIVVAFLVSPIGMPFIVNTSKDYLLGRSEINHHRVLACRWHQKDSSLH